MAVAGHGRLAQSDQISIGSGMSMGLFAVKASTVLGIWLN
jgi:hypothetical protein